MVSIIVFKLGNYKDYHHLRAGCVTSHIEFIYCHLSQVSWCTFRKANLKVMCDKKIKEVIVLISN